MVRTDQEETRSHFAGDVQPGFEHRNEATEVAGKKRYDFPHLGVSVEASSLEEAQEKAKALADKKPEGDN